jgi:type VI protein secretion system component VasK
MKAYIITTGTVFGLLTIMHIWRMVEEGSHLATEPWWVLITALAAALCVWAFWLLWRWPRARPKEELR